ncbi:retrovirus-related Pol polyprotein from transposon 297 [Trichonephila clavipes]|uniref:Retrovirus-related Pol polyprotein from transposon 297 n=1 Tax=Trichonephila clavipes TaxID=2585209 RepID=A0A8X6SQJ1_TRICX|nr:retrovirus-related Pol polyprotein from transposon 297 [Trichonephila clavipes]
MLASPQLFVFAITDDVPKFDIGPEIPKQTRNDVEALLVSYKSNKIKTTDIELSITVTDDKPIYHSPRRLPFTERDIVDKHIDEWTQNGVIEPCSSAYASQVLVVHKKDGSPRVCIDFRKLNRVLVKDPYPLPLIEDILDKLQDTRVFSTIDLLNGLTGYFRKFIPAYSVIAKPLSDILRKDTPFNFDVKQKASFDELKRLLCQKPVLGIYRQKCETQIHSDASIDGLAAALLQRSSDDNSLHPIYYMSRKTSEMERKYTSYEIEVLAIIESLKKFKVYILGMPFKIITDCNAFTKTMTVIDSFTKFVWLYPKKTTSTSEVIKKLDIQKTTFGNPRFLITNLGTTFTSDEFHTYCSEQKITLHHITTGLPLHNGQVERINRTIIPVLSKMSEDDLTKWFKHVPSLQEVLNSTFQ